MPTKISNFCNEFDLIHQILVDVVSLFFYVYIFLISTLIFSTLGPRPAFNSNGKYLNSIYRVNIIINMNVLPFYY